MVTNNVMTIASRTSHDHLVTAPPPYGRTSDDDLVDVAHMLRARNRSSS
jgi:hypothetical protein